jgi:hypothetical protein
MPQTIFDEAQHFCNRLKRISERNVSETGGLGVKLAFGLVELALDKEENGSDLIERAIAFLQNDSYS